MNDIGERWARKLAADDAWDWWAGMLVHATVEGDPSMYRLDGDEDGLYKKPWILVHEKRIYDGPDDVTDVFPDLDDPATVGCVWAMWRKAVDGMPYHKRRKAFKQVQRIVSEAHVADDLMVGWPDVVLFCDGVVAARAWFAVRGIA